jgi:WD40 repeat protein
MTDEIKYAESRMQLAGNWEKEEISVASLSELPNLYLSVGCDEGNIYLLDSSMKLKSEIKPEHKFPVIDHFWTGGSQVCLTQGKNIGLYDAEKQKGVAILSGHTDVSSN